MGTVQAAESYPRMRRRLGFIRLQQWARRVADFSGLGPSVVGRVCCNLIVTAGLFGTVLLMCYLIGLTSGVVVALLSVGFLALLAFGMFLMLVGSDASIAACQEHLLSELPLAKAIWEEQMEKLRLKQLENREQRRIEREAEAERVKTERQENDERLRIRKVQQAEAMLSDHPHETERTGYTYYEIEVVGESHYQKQLEKICGGRSREGAQFETTAFLILDDKNPYDSNAVRIEIKGYIVGYLSRDDAQVYRKRRRDVGQLKNRKGCKAMIVGGWDCGKDDRGHFGVRLHLPDDDLEQD